MTKREKMLYSGDLYELYVGDEISRQVNCAIRYNYRFYSPRINRGLECYVIVITSHKIYVIECKNYSSFIAGKRLSPMWTFVSSGKRGFVQNPILLNDRRVRTIKGHLYSELHKSYEVSSFVCVPSKCRINSNCDEVVTLPNLISKITFDSFNKPKYNLEQVSKDIDKIRWR